MKYIALASAVLVILVLCTMLIACSPSPEQVAGTGTAIALKVITELTANAPTSTFTASPTITKSPTPTRTATPNYSPTPRPTKTPTATPSFGTFANPASIGISITQVNEPLESYKMTATLLEVHRGSEANKLARTEMEEPFYKALIEGQEYIAVKMKLEVSDGPINEVFTLYPYDDFTLRYSETGDDVWSANVINIVKEGYPPLEGETWIFFLVKKDSKPLLYFQPDLVASEPYGYRTSGSFFSLTQP